MELKNNNDTIKKLVIGVKTIPYTHPESAANSWFTVSGTVSPPGSCAGIIGVTFIHGGISVGQFHTSNYTDIYVGYIDPYSNRYDGACIVYYLIGSKTM